MQICCSNIAGHRIESELFGYEKGTFADADSTHCGLVEMADGGTILLDELGAMPYPLQIKILRLLEEKNFRRLGSLQDTRANVMLLATSNRNLQNLVQRKKFRLDLYSLFKPAYIKIPPLREHPEDIPLLTTTFLKTFSKKHNSQCKRVTAEGMAIMQRYSWPGNISQLKKFVEKLVLLSGKNEISADDISLYLFLRQQTEGDMPSTEPADDLNFNVLSLEAMERKHIKTALKLTGGNQRKAAKLLAISRDTLRYRLKKFGIRP